MALDSPMLSKLRLARRLRRLRERARMSLDEAAALLDTSRSTLQRMETGETYADVHFVRSAMDVYDCRDDEMIDLARHAKTQGWWRAYGIPNRGYIGSEAGASLVQCWQLANMPGLLQTEDYMRAALGSVGVRSPQRLENDVQARLFRQRRLVDEDAPLRLEAIVDEAVLRRPIGGRTVLRSQLLRLIEATTLPTVSLQVMPHSEKANMGMDGAFTILRFEDGDHPDLVHLGSVPGHMEFEGSAKLERVKLCFARLREEALSVDDSVEFIEKIVANL
ncbi:helix-turn-helix domain-containing protein [Amycolatopsis sp. NPDC059021]|uniref:helix-turn-helix domain-containing protein n=1 Tax=Amycolatopsis sp. NPDC059021 TaxID=3346704 RepID=UPI00367203ED